MNDSPAALRPHRDLSIDQAVRPIRDDIEERIRRLLAELDVTARHG